MICILRLDEAAPDPIKNFIIGNNLSEIIAKAEISESPLVSELKRMEAEPTSGQHIFSITGYVMLVE
jgi:hypothetical protein